MDEQQDRGVLLSVLAGIGLGAIVGAAVALVLAPKSGAEIRDDLRVTLDDLKSKAEKVAADLSSKGEELVEKGREVVDSTNGLPSSAPVHVAPPPLFGAYLVHTRVPCWSSGPSAS